MMGINNLLFGVTYPQKHKYPRSVHRIIGKILSRHGMDIRFYAIGRAEYVEGDISGQGHQTLVIAEKGIADLKV